MRRFVMYRWKIDEFHHNSLQKCGSDEVQFQGIEFVTGRVVIQWLTAAKSISVFDNMEDLLIVHGHPEYGSELVWLDHG